LIKGGKIEKGEGPKGSARGGGKRLGVRGKRDTSYDTKKSHANSGMRASGVKETVVRE